MTQPQPQHHRHSSCPRHPTKPITGFCASCLRERLAGIDPDTHKETPITYLATELRRCKSYSSTRNPNVSSTSTSATTTTISEPRRKSCDSRPRNTLSDLFHNDDRRKYSFNWKPKILDLGLELKEEENGAEIRVLEEVSALNVDHCERILDDFEEDGEFKTMKEFIDLESGRKKNAGKDLKDIAGSFWEVASVFRKKLVKWQLKQKNDKKEKKTGGDLMGDIKKSSIRRLRDTQSEIGEYGFGRRSCDTDPRVSVDIARLSVDDSRYSFDEPRASWDGCLIGKTYPRLTPLVSVIEDAKLPANGIGDPGENVGLKNKEESNPGGTAQTRDYYSDRRRRRSFDPLGSNGRLTLGSDEFKSMSKVSPETVGLFHGAKLLVTEKELRDSNWYSLKDYTLEGDDGLAKDVDSVAAAVVDKKGFKFKNLQRWRSVWNIWALMQQKRSEGKCGDEESSNSGNVVDAENSTADFHNVEANETVSQKLIRSYTVSSRDSNKMGCSASIKKREELVVQRNRSARYSPNNLDNGLLRFYLTPLRSYGRSKSGKSRLQNSHSVARNVL
ncbi:protein OCTOPUS-like [Euphorbia lathyris]|uniref:protein OCTOPUS-like n=1 Tax=Euphorbia lathyris TaxID=212925 RepID=UPI003313B04E